MKIFARYPLSAKGNGSNKKRRRFLNWKLLLLLIPLAAGFAVLFFFGAWAQSFDMKKVGEMPERNTVFDFDGKIYSRLAGANRLRVSYNEVSPLFVDALLVREDARFFEHSGVDWRGVLRALYRDIMTRSTKEGASSITQQLARNSLPLGGRTLSRKLLEAMVAFRIERDYSKQQILELYMNRIYFGSGLLRDSNGVAGVFRKRRIETESFGSGAAGRTHSQSKSIFAVEKSRGRNGAA